MPEKRTYWNTRDEIRFLEQLGKGKWSRSLRVEQAGRERLLINYQAAAVYRRNWGEINRGQVLQALNVQLMDYMPI